MSPQDTKIGYLAQEMEFDPNNSVGEVLASAFLHVQELEAELLETIEAMGRSEEHDADMSRAMERYARVQEAFELAEGYTYPSRIDAMVDGLGIGALRERKVGSLSGGEKNVAALARVLLEEPDLLLLDEPANHLDFEGLAWLESFLQNCPQTVILVSHNRYLLDRVVGRIIEVQDRAVTSYVGNYSAYRAEKMRAVLKQQQAFEDQKREVRRMEEMILRFEDWAGRSNNPRHARQARNKQKQLDAMDRIDRPEWDRGLIDPTFGRGDRGGRIALELRGYSRAFGDRVLLDGVDLLIRSGERVGLLGANGTGKTTLLKDAMREAAWDHPTLRVGPRMRIGYYAQEHETLDPGKTILEEVRWEGGLTREQGFGLLSRFLFRWEDMDKAVSALSGGEKSRLQLAKLMVSDANLLLLDEPTNHLDIESREQVEAALEEFGGTLVVISHDRYFLDRIVDRIVEIRNSDVKEYTGNFSAFWEQRRQEQAVRLKQSATSGRPDRRRSLSRKTSTKVSEVSEDLLDQIDEMESEKLRIEGQIAEAYRRRDAKGGERLTRDLARVESRIEEMYGELR